MNAVIEKPTLHDQQIAQESLPLLIEAMADEKSEGISIQIQTGSSASPLNQANASSITIPAKALQLFTFILSTMAQGKTLSLIPSDSEVSTQQAADVLNVSRPHIVKLLEEGVIPFKKVGSHRRILLEDLLLYEAHQKQTRKEKLQFLVEQAQDIGLGY